MGALHTYGGELKLCKNIERRRKMGVKKFIKKSVAFVAAAAMALTMVVAPVGAGASASYAAGTGSTTTDPNPNLILDKSAKLQSDGTYTITLEAYAKGKVETTPAVIKPCDIVLVLDQSSSMAWNFSGNNQNPSYSDSRQKALRDAATSFIENVSKNARDKKVDHKMSIVTFGSDSSVVANNISLYNANNSGQNAKGESDLKNAITSLGQNPYGATKIDLGMKEADSLITEDSTTRNKIVVVFTDGYPNQFSGFDIGTADSATNSAKNLKDKNAKVYTIGIFNGADVNQVSGATSDEVGQYWAIGSGDTSDGKNAAANRFLNYMSSNFSDTSSLGLKTAEHKINYWDRNCYEITKKFTRLNSKYYMTANDQTELNNIFEKISDEVSEGKTDITLDETAVAKDIMSENFNLPNDVTNNVKVYTEDYKGKDTSNEPIWENRQPLNNPIVSYDTEEKSISVSGFSYKDNYIVDGKGSVATSGKKLIIVITDVTAKNAGMNMYTNNSNSAIYDGEGGKVKEFPMPQESIDSTSYVLDYGKTVKTVASDYGVNAVTIANADEPSPYNPKAAGTEGRTNVNLNGTYGKFAISGNDLTYTPGKINWDGIDTGYVFGQKSSSTSEYKWEEVNFMPASSVYYEDDFAQSTNSKDSNVKIIWTGDWKEQGKSKDNNQSSANIQYGWDNVYDNETGYSNGSTHAAYTKGATATFTFTGTGVDIYSRTDGVVGKVYAKLTGSSKANKDTTINKGLNVNNKSDSGTYYQIPTLSFDNLEYGTYTVKLTVLGNSTSENKEDGTAAYYLDGIRVYNPLGKVNDLNTTEGKAYDQAGELNAKYIKVRDILIDAKTFQGKDTFDTIKDDVSGTVFIDRIENDKGTTIDKIGTFEDLGPKNEVYLKKGQGIVFNIKNYNSNANANIFIGLKAMSGTPTTVEVTNGQGRTTKDINSANDLYYNITPDNDGNVVIKNTGDGLLSITKVRITTKSSSANTYSLRVTPNAMSYAKTFDSLPLTTDNKTEDKNDEDTTLGKDDVEIENPSEDKNNDNNQSNNNNNNFWNNVVNNFRKWFRR